MSILVLKNIYFDWIISFFLVCPILNNLYLPLVISETIEHVTPIIAGSPDNINNLRL
jgi:hypothetical protein